MWQQNDDAENGWQEVQTRRGRRVRGKVSQAHTSPDFNKLADVTESSEAQIASSGNGVAELEPEACNAAASPEIGPCNSFFQGDSDWFVVVERTFISLAPRHKLTHSSSAPGDLEGCLQTREASRTLPTRAQPWVPLTPHWSSFPLVRKTTSGGELHSAPARPPPKTVKFAEAASESRDGQRALSDEMQQALSRVSDDRGRPVEEVVAPALELDDGCESDESMPPLEPAELSPQTAAMKKAALQKCLHEEAARPQMVTIATQTEGESSADLQTHEDAGADKVASSIVGEGDGSEHASAHDDDAINNDAGSLKREDAVLDQSTTENLEVNAGAAADTDSPAAETSSAAVNKALRRARRRARLREAAQLAKQASESKEAEEAAAAAKKRAHERIVVLLRRARTQLLESVFHPWLQATRASAKTVDPPSDAKSPCTQLAAKSSAASPSDCTAVELENTQAKPAAKCRQAESRPFKEIRIESGTPAMWSGFLFHPSLPSMLEATQPCKSKLPAPEKGVPKEEAEAEEAEEDPKPQPDVKKRMLGTGHQIFSPVDFGMTPTSLFPSSISPVLEEAIQGKSMSTADSSHAETETPLSKAVQEQLQAPISDGQSSGAVSSTDGKHSEGQQGVTDAAAKAAGPSSEKTPAELFVRPNVTKKAVKFSPCSLPFVPQNVPKKPVNFSPCSLPFVPHMKAQTKANQSNAVHETKVNAPGAFSLCGTAPPASALAQRAERVETSVDVQSATISTVAQEKERDEGRQETSVAAAQVERAIAVQRLKQSGQSIHTKFTPDDSDQPSSGDIQPPAVSSEATKEERSADVEKPTVSVTQLDPMAQRAKSLLFAELQKMWAEEDRATGRTDGETVTKSSTASGSSGASPSKNGRSRRKAKAKVVPSGVVGQCVQSPDASRAARSSGPWTSGAASHTSRSGSSADVAGDGGASVKTPSESFSDTVAARVAARGLALLKAEMRKVQSSGSTSDSHSPAKVASRDSHSPAKGTTAGALAAATSAAAAAAGHRPGAASRLFTAAAARVRSGEVEVPASLKRSLRSSRATESSAAHGVQHEKDA